jgi:hypothetical protein
VVHPVIAQLGDFVDVPLVPALLEKVHRQADRKLIEVYSGRVLPYLAELTKSQIERGLITQVLYSRNALFACFMR